MRRRHPHRATVAVLAVSFTLAVSLDGQAAPAAPSDIAAGGADASAAADPLGWPQVDVVSITRRGGLNETVKAAALQAAGRVITTIRIDDRKDKPGTGRIVQKVQSLEAKLGKPLKR